MKCAKSGERIRRALDFPLILLGVCGLLYIGSNFLKDFDQEKSKFYEQVKIEADLNKDNKVDSIEWSKAYQIMGKEYNPHSSNPKEDLSYSDLEKYLILKK